MQWSAIQQGAAGTLDAAHSLAVDLADIPGKLGSLPTDPSTLSMHNFSAEDAALPLPKNSALQDAMERPRGVSWKEADPTPVVRT